MVAEGGAASTLVQGTTAAAQPAPTAKNVVVLVHGLFADGSSWSEVIARLSAVSTDHVWFAASIKEVQ
jgi:hypothetical protein